MTLDRDSSREAETEAEARDFTGPRDQIGFGDLKPARGPVCPEAGNDGGGGDGPIDDDETTAAPEPGRMGLLDHLDELRTVLIQCAIAAGVATVLCWFWSADLLQLLIRPIQSEGIYFTAPNEAFLTRLKLSGAVGLFVVAPFIFFRFYSFVLPGLYSRERRVATPLLLMTTLLFYTGVAFGFLVVIPQVVTFLLSFGTENLTPLIGVGPYFGFVSRLCLAFGLVFELPLAVLFLSVVGLVNPKMLLRTWRVAVVAIAALSAILTPPDVLSQIMMAGPVLLLYFGSVLVSIVVTRKRRAAASEAADAAAGDDRKVPE